MRSLGGRARLAGARLLGPRAPGGAAALARGRRVRGGRHRLGGAASAARAASCPPRSADVAPDLPREIASAVMGCLERSPQWRPKDLTYLAQLAAAQQKSLKRGPGVPAGRAAAAGRARPARTRARRPSRSHMPLLLATLFVLAAAAGSYLWIQRQGPDEAVTPGRAPEGEPHARERRARSSPHPSRSAWRATPRRPPAAAAEPTVDRPSPKPDSVPTPIPAPTPTPRSPRRHLSPRRHSQPTPTPGPRRLPRPLPRPRPRPPAPPPPRRRVADRVPGTGRPDDALAALDPPPGKVLLDLRGTGLRSDLRARVLPLREAPRGITVARQKWVSASLITRPARPGRHRHAGGLRHRARGPGRRADEAAPVHGHEVAPAPLPQLVHRRSTPGRRSSTGLSTAPCTARSTAFPQPIDRGSDRPGHRARHRFSTAPVEKGPEPRRA